MQAYSGQLAQPYLPQTIVSLQFPQRWTSLLIRGKQTWKLLFLGRAEWGEHAPHVRGRSLPGLAANDRDECGHGRKI